MKRAGIVLCGGRSTRMGLAKATLPFGPETMLQRVVRLLGEMVDRIVVVGAPHQDVPDVQSRTRVDVVYDRFAGRGPLEGLYMGLSALADDVEIEAAYATSCDVPLLAPEFVWRMFRLLGMHAIAVPKTDGYFHPLSAVYRPSVTADIAELLEDGRLRPAFLFERASTRVVLADELVDVDPELSTLKNLNRPEDYLAALAAAGFEPTPEVLAAWRQT